MNARVESKAGELVTQEPRTESNAIMALIERAATSNDIDVGKLEKLLDVKERWDRQQAKRQFDEAMTKFRHSAPTIARTAEGHNSKYAKLHKSLEAIQPLMHECGLSHSWRTNQDSGQIAVTCIVTHIAGHSEQTTLSSAPDTSGGKNSIQAIASAVSYLERYTLFAILGLASGEMDDDGKGAEFEPVTMEQAARLRDELEATGGDEKAFCRYAKVDSIEEVPAQSFNACLKTIQAAGKAREKK